MVVQEFRIVMTFIGCQSVILKYIHFILHTAFSLFLFHYYYSADSMIQF